MKLRYKHLKDVAPTLSKIEKQNPFTVPEKYFDTLPTIIQERCAEKARPSWDYLQLILNPKIIITVSTAVVVIVVGIIYFILPPTGLEPDRDKTAQLSADEIALVMEDVEAYNIDENLIVEALIEDESYGETADNESDEEIIDYLLENGIELSTIINEL